MITRLTDEEHKALSQKVKKTNDDSSGNKSGKR